MVNTTAAAEAMNCGGGGVLPLASLNHISLVCRSVEASRRFYADVLGFVRVRRPGSFDFDGEWLFNYGIGIHLLQAEDPDSLPAMGKREINPKDNHISFQCESMDAVERRLEDLGIEYVKRTVEEGGINVEQIFFHDPDGFMIEVCNCDNLPVVPLGDNNVNVNVMPACSRRVPAPAAAVNVKHQQQSVVPSAAPPAVAPPPQCVPSANAAAAAIRVGEEAHISCA